MNSTDILENISVDNLIFAMDNGQLKILLAKYDEGEAKGKWGLVGHWVKIDEDLETAAARVVKQTTGVQNLYLEQLCAFGRVNRFPAKRVVTIAFYSLVRLDEINLMPGFTATDLAWFDARKLPSLIFDHLEIVEHCLSFLRYKVRHEPIGFNLLPEKFTLLELQELYETVLDKKLDKPNFRRKIQKMNLLIDCKEKQKGVAHRAANLYRFDINVYQKLTEFGFSFEY
ncbi:NUDIX hydrolase [Algibacillus agarilyticus]|uniref:NUDIX hydrolase n=1 Tax=Algibacillus agarilyticus TaxID=2234133 RepID=UPI000DD0C03F|nr:NUDIX domain-containing protein [Algibacillus agarilyticus]